jgi:hypothetical protein
MDQYLLYTKMESVFIERAVFLMLKTIADCGLTSPEEWFPEVIEAHKKLKEKVKQLEQMGLVDQNKVPFNEDEYKKLVEQCFSFRNTMAWALVEKLHDSIIQLLANASASPD